MNELINDMRWLACVLLFICAICDANDDLGAYTACRYAYDSTGNRTEKDCDGQKTRYAYNSLDQLTEEQTATGPKTTYRWDGRGNLLEKSTPAQTIRYEWSSDNRLLKASDGSASIRYGYDALGRRIIRTREAGGQKQETQWILDTARPYSEIVLERSRQNGGAWQETRYTHTPDGVGQLISEQRQGKMLHVYEDVPRQRAADIYDLKGWQHTAWHPKESAIPEKFRLSRMELNWLVMRRISFCVNAKWKAC